MDNFSYMKVSRVVALVLIAIVTTIASCKSRTSEIDETTTRTVLVQVHDDDSIPILEDAFKEYDLAKEKIVSNPMSIYLFTFNTAKITDLALIKLLKESELVKEAQQNRNVQIRNTN